MHTREKERERERENECPHDSSCLYKSICTRGFSHACKIRNFFGVLNSAHQKNLCAKYSALLNRIAIKQSFILFLILGDNLKTAL